VGGCFVQVKQLHPYDEPELISMPITGGSGSYLSWVLSSTQRPE